MKRHLQFGIAFGMPKDVDKATSALSLSLPFLDEKKEMYICIYYN